MGFRKCLGKFIQEVFLCIPGPTLLRLVFQKWTGGGEGRASSVIVLENGLGHSFCSSDAPLTSMENTGEGEMSARCGLGLPP